MVRALCIPADADEPITELRVDTLEDYQVAVGGWIEPVDVLACGVTVYVAEEGLLRKLPFNSRATVLWWYFVPEARQTAMLVGPALVVGLPTRNGSSTDVPAEVAETMLGCSAWCVEVKVHGDPKWYGNQATFADYFEALVWAMALLERWTATEDTRVVPVSNDKLTRGALAPPDA